LQELPVGGASQKYTSWNMLKSRSYVGTLHEPQITAWVSFRPWFSFASALWRAI